MVCVWDGAVGGGGGGEKVPLGDRESRNNSSDNLFRLSLQYD